MKHEQWILCPVCGCKTRLKIREDTVLENFPLYCPKRARRTDAEPITHKAILLVVIGFFDVIHDNTLPRPTGKEKKPLRGRLLSCAQYTIPAAVLKHISRPPFSFPSN